MPITREVVTAPDAPDAVGPYSHAVKAGDLLFCSGQIPLDPATMKLVEGNAAQQAERCLRNLQAVCAAAGTTLERAVKITVYLADLSTWGDVNEAYATFFPQDPPARVAFGAAALPMGALVEIDAIVAL